MYDRLDPEGPPAMIQLLRKPLVDVSLPPVTGDRTAGGKVATS
jgi:hypothetical protein